MNADALAYLAEKGLSIDEIIEFARLSERKRDNTAAERQARKRERDRHAVTVTRDESPLSLPPNENNSNPPTHTPPDMTTRARKADPFPRPDWCSEQIWNDLKANRKAKRLPNTASAHAKLLRDLEAMSDDDWPPGRLLEAIVARGWAAAYDPRENRNDRPPNFSRTAKPDPLLAMRAIARAQIEAEDSGGYPGDGFGAGPTLRALGSG